MTGDTTIGCNGLNSDWTNLNLKIHTGLNVWQEPARTYFAFTILNFFLMAMRECFHLQCIISVFKIWTLHCILECRYFRYCLSFKMFLIYPVFWELAYIQIFTCQYSDTFCYFLFSWFVILTVWWSSYKSCVRRIPLIKNEDTGFWVQSNRAYFPSA